MKAICPNTNDLDYQFLVKEVGEDSAYKIWLDNGQQIPKGDNLKAYIDRENTQNEKLANLDKRHQVEQTIELLSNPNLEKTPDGKFYINKKTGEVLSKRVSMLVDQYYRQQGIYFKGDKKFYAHKGTVAHEYISTIINALNNGENISLANAYNEVRKLKQLEEFKKYDDNSINDSFFGMTQGQFNQLFEGVSDLITDIKDLQKSIDPKGEVKIFTEVPIMDEYRDLGGTIDLLAVFSDGTASIYDFKTFKSDKNESPGTVKIGAWAVQLSNYRNMLKDNYGINQFRHTRVIPIRTSFSRYDTATQTWVNELANGFNSLGIKTKRNNLEGLDPIPFRESKGDERIDRLINDLEDKVQTLDNQISYEHVQAKKFNMQRQRKRLIKALNDLELGKEIDSLFDYIRNLARSSKVKFDKYKDGELTEHDVSLVDLHSELKIYEDLALNFSNQLNEYGQDKKVELKAKLQNAQEYIKDLMFDINSEIIDNAGGNNILEPGQMPGNDLSKMLYGLGNWNVPIFQKLLDLWRYADEVSRNQTHSDIDTIGNVDKVFSEWAKKNGISQKGKFSLLLDEKKQLHDKYINNFYETKEELRKKASKGKLTTEDKKWLAAHFKFDVDSFKIHKENLMSNIKYDLEIRQITQKMYDSAIEKFNKFSNPATKADNKFSKGNFKFLVPKENNSEFINPKWQYIQNNQPVKDYFDMLKDYNEKWIGLLGRDALGSNFVPNVHQSLTDHLLEYGSKNFKEVFFKKYQIRSNDAISGRVDAKGNLLPSIPILHLDKLRHNLSEDKKKLIEQDVEALFERGTSEFIQEVEKRIKDKQYEIGLDAKSTDLTKSFMLFAASVNEFINLSHIEPMVKNLKYLIDSDQVKQKAKDKSGMNIVDKLTGSVMNHTGFAPDTKKIFETFVNRLIYKQKFEKELFASDKYSSNKIIMDLMNWLSVRALGLNVVIGGANFIQGKTNMWMMAKEGRYFDKHTLKESFKAFSRHDEQYADVMMFLEPSARSIIHERIELSGASFASRRLRTRTWFLTHIKGDDHIDFALASAMSKRYVVDSDGIIKNPKYDTILNKDAKSVYDSIVFNEQENKLEIPGVSTLQVRKFRAKIQKQGNLIKGTMSEEHKGAFASSMLFTMFMQFRNWSIGLGETRFGELKYDSTMENFEIGRFNAAIGGLFGNGVIPALKETSSLLAEVALMGLYKRKPNLSRIKIKYDKFLRENPEYKGQLNIDQYQELIKDKLNGFLAEARVYLSILLLVQLLRGLDWDDREESNIFTWNAFQITRRSLLEVSFWFNPRSVDEIVRSPLPLWGLVREVERIVDSSVREVTYAVKGDRPAAARYPTYYILKSTPGINQVLSFNKFFEEYRPPATWVDHVFSIWESEDEE